ncbi:DUF5696 domain-containing protein [Paenibacillus mendelii]|uniref:DUF5696 domain-containing protein n=1 Tax=Paenibacillus mendelii TaxID=206163 RepID=A0ABV6JAI0_9BACL|nr:DUF5696 domain-containing protein [Paenibacillus mendelii]MCQ6560711.1 DUF5696 domain-containing protein [Paenibacillus mendelii]
MSRRNKALLGIVCACLILGGFAGLQSAGQVASRQAGGSSPVDAADAGAFAELTMAAGKQGKGVVATAASSAISGAVTPPTAAELQALSAMELAAENKTLMLYVNRETAEIAVKDKRDGYAWFSNPVGRDQDSKASPLFKAESASQVLVSYFNEKGQINSLNSYNDSVMKKQFTIDKTEHGLKVVYQLGHVSKGFDNVPSVIDKDRFEEVILSRISEEDTRSSVEFRYRFNEETQQYEIRKLQDYALEELSQALESIGYSAEDAAKDAGNGSGEAASADKPEFTIPLEYVLDGDQLVVKIPASELTYTKTYPIASLHVLKHFGAAGEEKEGYIFVPDGSGALIHLNNKRLNVEPYNMPIYGKDGTFDVKEKTQRNETARLPVFGMKQNDHVFLGVIESGDAMADITADISGRNDSFNTASAKFQIVSMDFYTLTSGTKTSSVPMFQTKTYQGDIQIRYAFLSGDSANYTGMARLYRNYLVQAYGLEKVQSADAPFLLELIGAFPRKKSFLGIPYESTESLTSYSEAERMLRQLKENGVNSIALRYIGWFNGGIRHDRPSDIDLVRALGGKRAFESLVSYTKESGIALYPDTALLQAYEKPSRTASFLDRQTAKIYDYDPIHNVKNTSAFSHYIQSATGLDKLTDQFLADYTKLGIGGLSLRDLGSEVNSDFDPDHPISRQDALHESAQAAGKLKKQVGQLMVSGGNAYSLPFASHVVHAPTQSSGINLADEDVPFYQIALHGYVDLAGAPFNMEERQDPRYSLLKALETGSNLYYQWSYSPSSDVKDTPFNDMYALYYKDWFDEAVSLYKEANSILKQVRGMAITDHRKLQRHVVQTTFEGGTSIIVNYNKTAVQVNGIHIDARSYKLGGE